MSCPAIILLLTMLCCAVAFVCAVLRAVQQIKPDFSNYDDAGAWPYLMDEFVEYMRKKNGMQVD